MWIWTHAKSQRTVKDRSVAHTKWAECCMTTSCSSSTQGNCRHSLLTSPWTLCGSVARLSHLVWFWMKIDVAPTKDYTQNLACSQCQIHTVHTITCKLSQAKTTQRHSYHKQPLVLLILLQKWKIWYTVTDWLKLVMWHTVKCEGHALQI